MDLSGETTNLAIPDAETKPAVVCYIEECFQFMLSHKYCLVFIITKYFISNSQTILVYLIRQTHTWGHYQNIIVIFVISEYIVYINICRPILYLFSDKYKFI